MVRIKELTLFFHFDCCRTWMLSYQGVLPLFKPFSESTLQPDLWWALGMRTKVLSQYSHLMMTSSSLNTRDKCRVCPNNCKMKQSKL